MRSEIRYIEPLRCANVVALIYGSIGLIVVLVALPFLLLSFLAFRGSDGMVSTGIMFGMVLVYPIVGLFAGWLGGFVVAAIYNLVVRWVGGISIELTSGTAV